MAVAALLAAVYFGVSQIGLAFVSHPGEVAVLWPASGVALAAVLLAPRPWWGALAVGVFAGNIAAQLGSRPDPALASALAAVNAAEPFLAAVTIRSLTGDRRTSWDDLAAVRALLAGSIVGAVAAGAAGAAALGLFRGAPFLDGWETWALADGLGMVVVTPVLLAAAGWRAKRSAVDALDVVLAVAAVGVAVAVFWAGPPGNVAPGHYTYATFPLLVWLAVRGSRGVTALAALGVGTVAVLAMAAGRGPLTGKADDDALHQALATQGYLAVLVVTLAAIGAVVADERRSRRTATAEVERFRSLLRATSEFAVIATDVDGVVTVFGDGAERMLGRSADVVVGRLTPMAFHRAEEVEARAAELGIAPGFEVLVHAARSGRPETRDWTYVRADGSHLLVSLTVTPIRDAHGRPAGYFGLAQDVTAKRGAQRALQAAHDRYRQLAGAVPDAITALFDRDLRCTLLEGATLDQRNVDRTAFVGRPLEDIVPTDRAAVLRPLFEAALLGETRRTEYVSTITGHVSEVEVAPTRDVDGAITGVFGLMRDLTEPRRHQLAVARSERDFEAVFDSAAIAQLSLGPDDRIGRANAALLRLAGEPVDGLPLEALVRGVDAAGLHDAVREIRAGRAAGGELEVVLQSGAIATVYAAPLSEGQVLLQLVDVTERRRYERRLQHLADHDALTGLPNRRRFEEELDRHLDHARRYGDGGAVCILDIDHFKQVNDTLGHSVGDELIVSVAHLLRDRLRSSDTIARLGGDEFAIILPRATRDQARSVAEDLIGIVRERAGTFDERRHREITVSMGVTMVGENAVERTAEELMVEADLAMYDAKAAGRGRFAFYDDDDGHGPSRTQARLHWVDRIEAALRDDRFTLLAQPILELSSDTVTQHELLLRMLDDDGGHVPPGAFLYIAERYGLAPRIDRWVLSRAIDVLADLERQGRPHRFEVNVSGHSLGDDALLEHVEADLERTGVDPRSLVIEITETAAIADIRTARRFAERLSDLGCGFALDDFGAGFGSFYYLKHLPSDLLKIDGEFIRNCTTNRDDQVIIGSLVSIARGMGKRTVAEFVGDEATRRCVAELGVDYAQGYEIGRPMPVDLAIAAARR